MESNVQLAILFVAIGSIFSILLAFIWIAVRLGPKGRGRGNPASGNNDDLFNDEYREKLRARGVMRFEKALDQNAALLQGDLRKISDEVTEYIKDNVSTILKDQLDDQKQTLIAAEERMAGAFNKVDGALEDYRKTMINEMKNELQAEKNRKIAYFESNLTDIVDHYIKETLASEIDLSKQMEYIIKNLETNKAAIIEDLKHEV